MAQVQEVVDTPNETNGASADGAGAGRKVGAPNVKVNWGLKPISKLPPKRSAGFQRTSEVHKALESIKADPNLHGQAFELGTYDPADARANTSARAKASQLRKSYPAEEGWEFRVGESENEPGRVALTVQYA